MPPGALLILKYWEPISAFFGGVIEGLSAAFAPLGELFSPLLQAFGFISEKLGGIWQWFIDLIAPIKATQETLDSCKNVGVAFGQALGDALMAPLNLFNSLRGKGQLAAGETRRHKKRVGQYRLGCTERGTSSADAGQCLGPGVTCLQRLHGIPADGSSGRTFLHRSE